MAAVPRSRFILAAIWLAKGTLRNILADAGLTIEDLQRLL
jgi:hypothetical protein